MKFANQKQEFANRHARLTSAPLAPHGQQDMRSSSPMGSPFDSLHVSFLAKQMNTKHPTGIAIPWLKSDIFPRYAKSQLDSIWYQEFFLKLVKITGRNWSPKWGQLGASEGRSVPASLANLSVVLTWSSSWNAASRCITTWSSMTSGARYLL